VFSFAKKPHWHRRHILVVLLESAQKVRTEENTKLKKTELGSYRTGAAGWAEND
jgi:hypothetical protein